MTHSYIPISPDIGIPNGFVSEHNRVLFEDSHWQISHNRKSLFPDSGPIARARHSIALNPEREWVINGDMGHSRDGRNTWHMMEGGDDIRGRAI